MPLTKLNTLVAFSLASLLISSGQLLAGVTYVAPGVAGSVTNVTVGGAVYDVAFVGTVTHTAWANQLDFHTEAEAEAAIVAVAAELNASTATTLHFTVPGGTFDFSTGTLWYSADATSLYGESLIRSGSTWKLAFPFPGGATAPLNSAFALALDFTRVSAPVWADVGGGIAGVSGEPQLDGIGTLVGGQPGSINLTHAKPSSPAVLFVALSSVPLPFKGGTLVAVPTLLTLVLTTSPAGAIPLPFTWPTGLPSGLDVYYQYGIQDAAAVKGVALSNALKSTTP